MKKLNVFLTLSSLNVLVITAERFSFTTKILLQPYNFVRLHELVQISVLILASVLLPFCVLYIVSDSLKGLRTNYGKFLAIVFLIGIYFYAAGNGVHELASFLLNHFCNPKHVVTAVCQNFYFNDYYFGNILYFFGGFFMVLVPILFERIYPNTTYQKRDYLILFTNAGLYALAIFAYAAFDVVLVGFYYTLITTIAIDCILLVTTVKRNYLPLTIYSATAYTIGLLLSLTVRLH